MIYSIYIAQEHGGRQQFVTDVELIAGCGITGDRNYGESESPGQNITFIELEETENFNQMFSQNISIFAPRRNVITKGVRLNPLVGVDFYIGNIKFRGIEFCEPCVTLGELLENETISKVEVIKAFIKRAGLRADVLSSGKLSVGMEFKVHEAA